MTRLIDRLWIRFCGGKLAGWLAGRKGGIFRDRPGLGRALLKIFHRPELFIDLIDFKWENQSMNTRQSDICELKIAMPFD